MEVSFDSCDHFCSENEAIDQLFAHRYSSLLRDILSTCFQLYTQTKDEKLAFMIEHLLHCFVEDDRNNVQHVCIPAARDQLTSLVSQLCDSTLSLEHRLRNEFFVSRILAKLETKSKQTAVDMLLVKLALIDENSQFSNQLLSFINSHNWETLFSMFGKLTTSNPYLGEFATSKLIQLHLKQMRSFGTLLRQCLNETVDAGLKNTIYLLNILPDEELKEMQICNLQAVLNMFPLSSSPDDDQISNYYASLIGRSTCKLSKKLADTQWNMDKSKNLDIYLYYDETFKSFKVEACFIASVLQKTHFLEKVISLDTNLLDLVPNELKIVYLLDKLSSSIVDFDTTNYLSLMGKLKEITFQTAFLDPVVENLVQNLSWIFKFTEWATIKLSLSNVDNVDRQIRMFQGFAKCESPLNVLHKHLNAQFFSCDIKLLEEISILLSEYRKGDELMVWFGYMAIKLMMMCIMQEKLDDSEKNLYQVKMFLQKLFPLTFRVEILENLFSLLFVTVNEAMDEKDFDHEEDEYNDDSCPTSAKNNSEFGDQCSFQNQKHESITSFCNFMGLHQSSDIENFLFPSELVPGFLALLKDVVIETQTSIFILQRSNTMLEENNRKIYVNSSVSDINDCKIRLKLLEGHITDAKWRYVVIEPTFVQQHSPINNENLVNDLEYEEWKETEDLENILSNEECGFVEKEHKEMFSSVIQCMLASPDQLLRYCLIEQKIDKAKEVYKLFNQFLKGSEEAYELLVVEKYEDLSSKLKIIFSEKGVSSASKHVDTVSQNSRKNEVESLLHEFHLFIASETDGKVKSDLLSVDFAVSSSPNALLSQIVLDSKSFANNEDNDINAFEKLDLFLTRVSMIILTILKSNEKNGLPFLFSYCLEDIFTDPSTVRDEHVKNKDLMSCLTLLKQMLFPQSSEMVSQVSTKSYDLRKVIIEYQKLIRFCPTGKYSYLNALFSHIRKVSKALTECKKRSESFTKEPSLPEQKENVCMKHTGGTNFSVLYASPSATLCTMILKHKFNPKIVDDLAKDMRVDLIETLCSLHSPTIPAIVKDDLDFELVDSCHPALCELIHCHYSGSESNNESVYVQNHFEDSDDFESESTYSERIKNEELIEYFRMKSWILVEVLDLLGLLKLETLSKIRDQFVIRPNTPLGCWISFVCDFLNFGTKEDPVLIKALAFHPKIPASHSTTMKALERLAQNKDLVKMYDLLRLIDSRNSSSSLVSLRTAVLSKLTVDTQNIKFALQVEDLKTKCDLIYQTLISSDSYSDPNIASRALKSVSTVTCDVPCSIPAFVELKLLMNKVLCYTKIGELAGLRSWKEALNSLEEVYIITILKTRKSYSLALEWNELRPKCEKSDIETEELMLELLALAYCEKKDFMKLEIIFKSSVNFILLIEKILPQIDEWESKCFVVSFLLNSGLIKNDEEKMKYYRNYMTGINLINTLSTSTRSLYIPLCTQPSLIVEQMLMNLEFDALEKSVKSLQLIECDELLEKYAKKAVDIEIVDNISLADSDTTMISSSILNETGFVMPTAVPTVEQWIPDNRVTYCMHCRVERFSMFNRRHHCRRCGRVVCANCSRNSLIIPEVSSLASVRVCDDCFSQTKLRSPRKESMSSLSSSTKILQWILTLCENQNEITREEFFYESAPSSSLCLSILKLHTNNKKCASVIIDKFCKPLFEILASNQVDYGLVINTIKSLLISAKVLVADDDSSSLNKISILLARLDIIKMLVNENCLDRILISCIINDENAFLKLQEKLIEMERFELALNIAMKFGINLKPIWKTWAFVCLKNFKFSEARIKYKHCFTTKIGETNSNNSKLLEEIFDVLVKLSCKINCSSLRERCKSIKDGGVVQKYAADSSYHRDKRNSVRTGVLSLKEKTSLISNKIDSISNRDNFKTIKIGEKSEDEKMRADLKETVMQEAFYYLETYGSKEDIVKFYLQFEYYKKVVDTFITEINPASMTSTFITMVLIPLLNKGSFKKFLGVLHSSDPTLSKSWKYLLASCKYLSQNNYYIVLHNIQVFMRDYIRAAVTQINYFYLFPPAINYKELYQRKEHLIMAIQHCRDYLSNIDNLNKGCFYMSPADVTNQIRTINVQIEISTKFYEKGINGIDEISHELQEIESKNSKSPPTLLDHDKLRKTLLTALVAVEAGPPIIEGFTLSQQIIRDHGLDAVQVFKYAGKLIIRHYTVEVLSEFLGCIRESLSVEESMSLSDDIVVACIRSSSDTRLIEQLIKLLISDVNKIDAYISCNKLKSAYLLAVKLDRHVDVRKIHSLAVKTNQEKVRQICEAFLVKFENI